MTGAEGARRAIPVLCVAVTAISAAAILVRLAEGVHPVGAAFWRTAAVSVLLAPTLLKALLSHGQISKRDIGLGALAGLLLAFHFWAWFASLAHTTVLRSTLLVCLTPLWAGLLEWGLFGQRPSGRYWAGIALALGGVGVMSVGQAEGTASLLGDGLATVGGILSASYLLVGRRVRQRVPIGPYGSLVSGAAALWLAVAAFALDVPLFGYSQQAWLALLGMALGPQLLGHIGLNFAVGYLPAYVVGAAVLFEPVGTAILGARRSRTAPSAGARRPCLGDAECRVPERVGLALREPGWGQRWRCCGGGAARRGDQYRPPRRRGGPRGVGGVWGFAHPGGA